MSPSAPGVLASAGWGRVLTASPGAMTARHSRRATWAATHGTAVDSTLLKGLHLLEVLIASDDPRGVSELAAQLGLARSNVHRVLKTLEAAGYVRHATGANTYVPTLKVWELGTKVHGRLNIAKEARPFIEALMLRTNETTQWFRSDLFRLVPIARDHPQRAWEIAALVPDPALCRIALVLLACVLATGTTSSGRHLIAQFAQSLRTHRP